MMGDFRIMAYNKFDLATLAASEEAAGFAVERIQHEQYLKAWRSTGLSAVTVDANLGSALDIKAFFAYYVNIREGARFKIQADADPAYGSLNVDDTIAITADMESFGIVGKFWTAAQAYRYWRQLISDDASGHPLGYIYEGRAFLGDYFQPSYRPSVYAVPDDIDPSTILVSLGGQKTANILTQYSRYEFQWSNLPPTDIEALRAIYASVGVHKAIFIVMDSADPIGTLLYAKIVELQYTPDPSGYFSARLLVETER